MPQKPNWVEDKPTPNWVEDFPAPQTFGQPQQQSSDFDWWIDKGLRTLPAVAGSLIGGATGFFGAGVGAIPGAMGGGAIGSALGNWAAQKYSGEEFNLPEFGVETVLGAAPPIFGPIKAPASAGVKELLKYAGKSALSGAAEGAIINTGATPFQHAAETGSFNAPLESYLANAGAGAGMGGILGGAIGGVQGRSLSRPPAIDTTGSTLDTTGLSPTGDLLSRVFDTRMEETGPPSFEPFGPEISPYGTGVGQQDLLEKANMFGKPFRSAEVSAAMRNAANQPPAASLTEEFNRRIVQSPPPSEIPPGIPASTTTTPKAQGPEIITVRDPTEIRLREAEGYVVIPNKRSPDNFLMMARGDVAPVFGPANPASTVAPPAKRPDIPSATDEGVTTFGEGEDIPISVNKAKDKTVVENLAKHGYRPTNEKTPDGKVIFRYTPGNEVSSLQQNEPDPNENWVSDQHDYSGGGGDFPSQMHDPNDPFAPKPTTLRPGEQGGRVAPFVSRANNFFELTQELDRGGLTDGIVIRAQELIDQYKTASQARTDYNEILYLLGKATDPDKAETLRHIADSIKEKANDLDAAEFAASRPKWINPQTGESIEPPLPPSTQQSGVTVTNAPARPGAQRYTIDESGSLSLVDRPRDVLPRDVAVPPEVGQGELPLMGMIQQNRLANIGNRDINTDVGMVRQEPTQLSFEGALKDAEIKKYLDDLDNRIGDYLRKEDAFPTDDVDPGDISEMANRGPSTGARIQALRQSIDEAYRANDIKRVIDLSQQLEEILYPGLGAKGLSGGANTPTRAQGSDPMKWHLGPHFWGQTSSIRPDLTRLSREAAQAQLARARQIGIDPTGMTEEQLSQAIYDRRQQLNLGEDTPSNMEVPGTRTGGRLGNIAVGGADEPVLDMLATALYTRDRASTVVKELFQNAADEMKISGRQAPIRIAFRHASQNPATGRDQRSVVVQDFGRGMLPEQLYTIFTDVGKSGKRDVSDASGGFGFAKAAPLLGGDYVVVESIVKDSRTGKLMRYTFEGNPAQMKNQKVGVPLKAEVVTDPSVTTGFRVETFFPNDKPLYPADALITQTVENSPGMKGVEIFEDYNTGTEELNKFLKTGKTGWSDTYLKEVQGQPVPTKKGMISTSGAEIDIHFELDNKERKGGKIAYLNNGLFALEDSIGYGFNAMPHVPGKIVANIKATVPEGTEGYPFGLNREELNRDVLEEIKDWIKQNVVKDAEKIRIAELQKVYDDLKPIGNNRHVVMDSGGRYTPDELARVQTDPHLRRVAADMGIMLGELDALFPVGAPGGQLGRTAKYGFQISDHNKGGVNIPSPQSPSGAKEYAIMINPLGLISQTPNPKIAAEKIAHAILHEFNHNLARNEGGDFTWKLLVTDSTYGTDRRAEIAKSIQSAITGPDGNYAPGIQRLLQEYTAARGRPDTTVDTLSRQRESEWVGGDRQGGVSSSDRDAGGGTIRREIDEAKDTIAQMAGSAKGAKPADKKKAETNFVQEVLAFPTAATTTGDFSAPGRQGLTMILTPQFWKAAGKMFKGLSKESFDIMDKELHKNPIMRRPLNPETGELGESVAQKMGLKIFRPASDVRPGQRAEGIASRWMESGFGNDPFSKFYAGTVGKFIVRPSNRAYITFLNELNVNRAEFLMNKARDMAIEALETGYARPGLLRKQFTSEAAMNLNPYHNEVLAKEIGDFMNTATGHAPLRTHFLPHKSWEINLEKASSVLAATMFSPGLLFSRIRMLNPSTYIMASPYVRKQYTKAALSAAAAWAGFTTIAEMAGADVGRDPTSADFGKIKVGNTRIDPGAGFLQFAVLYNRMYQGGYSSSATGEFHRFGEGFQAETQLSNLLRFGSNKLNPFFKFAHDVMDATEYKPFHVGDRTAQLFVPLFTQDVIGVVSETPELIPWLVPMLFGVGAQTYSKGESVGKIIAPENDWLATGGGIADLGPDYIHPRLNYDR
jgi:hypothetical protein